MNQNVNFCDKTHFLILKATAIIAIIIGHIGNFTGKTWFTPLGGFGVAIFLFCSGYGLTVSAKKGGVDKYWSKKLINVYLPFLIIECVAALILHNTFKSFILDITLIKPTHPYGWYMQYIFLCYLLFYVIFKFVKNQNICITIFFVLAIVSFFVFPNLQAEQALSFIFGVFTANYIETKSVKQNKLILLGFLLLFIGIMFLAIKQMPYVRTLNHYIITLFNLIIKLSAAMGVIALSYSFSRCLKFLIPFGKISYELYLIHGYFIFVISENLLGNFVFNAFVFLAIIGIVSWLFYITNIQIQKGLRRVFEIELSKNISNKQ